MGGVTDPTYALTFGNLPQTNDSSSTGINSSSNIKTISFTLPVGQDYTLDDVILRLQNYDIGDVPVVQIRNDTGGSNPGATVLANFTNPTAQGTGIFGYTFIPSSSLTLQAATKYWLYVTTTGSNSYLWRASSPNVNPTGFATFGASRISSNGGTSFSNSSTSNSFQINATPVSAAVPFEFNPLIGMFGFFGSSFILRKIKTRKIKTKTIPS